MVNPFKEVNWNPNTVEKRRFALSLIIGCPASAIVLLGLGKVLHSGWHFRGPGIIAAVGLIIGPMLWVAPILVLPFYRMVYFVACCIGIVVSNFLLILFFYAILTPVALLLRLFGRASLQKSFTPQSKTYWKEVDRKTEPTQYYRQF